KTPLRPRTKEIAKATASAAATSSSRRNMLLPPKAHRAGRPARPMVFIRCATVNDGATRHPEACRRHARARRGYSTPRKSCNVKGVDGRDGPGHDAGNVARRSADPRALVAGSPGRVPDGGPPGPVSAGSG